MKTALVHDWLINPGGAERCLESIRRLYPGDVYTLVSNPQTAQALGIPPQAIHNSFIQNLPFARKKYRSYLPFFPLAAEQFDLSGCDLVISSSHAAAKGVLTSATQLHICYCYTPMRYAWDLHHQYLREAGLDRGLKGWAAKAVLHYMRLWDRSTADRVDRFVAISAYTARRIKKTYGRDSTVIYPPVDVDRFEPSAQKEDFYLTASRMVPYKKIDLIVEAFSAMPDKKLVVIGDGPDFAKINAKAGPNVSLLGYQPFPELREHMRRARAFVFAAEEDFGIVPVEAQACGTPVIAYGRGGALETVLDGKTGFFFREQSVKSLQNAVALFERRQAALEPAAMRANAERFSRQRFEKEFGEFVEKSIAEFYGTNKELLR